ncbi:SMI1/KNR4 family protein [Microvirga guangxiensis]|uniref:SMI1 / KNR4 family (SUKH-1) n=1 Tax=Microvirga guangxiensis TaxID=549386 RepID=A0A1G5FXT1_9HYPH|nr:SMI1/KNR4 family protein [Microvirga guangxiensis]SCY43994.1 SMI1 / KNR4 family (SUKH-1) [Microvirga guangxiensis]
MPRLIVPLPEHWYSNEPGWSSVKNPSQDIARWESETGLSLPDDYRRFMLAFNGGYVYPSHFRHGVPRNLSPHGGDATFVSQFYNWTIAERYWHGEMWGKAKPPDMFEIGSDPDGLSIFLSLRSADHGQVFCWSGFSLNVAN